MTVGDTMLLTTLILTKTPGGAMRPNKVNRTIRLSPESKMPAWAADGRIQAETPPSLLPSAICRLPSQVQNFPAKASCR